jgi:hypothetical protein
MQRLDQPKHPAAARITKADSEKAGSSQDG